MDKWMDYCEQLEYLLFMQLDEQNGLL